MDYPSINTLIVVGLVAILVFGLLAVIIANIEFNLKLYKTVTKSFGK